MKPFPPTSPMTDISYALMFVPAMILIIVLVILNLLFGLALAGAAWLFSKLPFGVFEAVKAKIFK